MPAYRDPDEMLVVLFKHLPIQNPQKTLAEGRPVFDNVEHCEIRSPGCKDVKIFPANFFSRWVDDPYTGAQRKQSYAERFQHQYRQFISEAAQTKSGTPLEHVPFLSEGRRAELRAQNLYTVEALADIEGTELKNLGPGGRDLKNQAVDYINESRTKAPGLQMMAELEALRARNVILEEDLQIKKRVEEREEGEFAGMDDEQLREFITTQTGFAPHHKNGRKTLVRMAMDARPNRVA